MRDGTSLASGRARTTCGIRVLGAAALVALLGVGCGKEASNPDQGTGGSSTAGSAGSSNGGKGGSAAGSAGNASAGSGSAEGGKTSGGSGSAEGGKTSGGSGSVEGGKTNGGSDQGGEAPAAECETADDCAVLDDCCSCSAVATSSETKTCDEVCIQSACAAHDLEGVQAVCEKKRCVFELSCDRSLVTCRVAAPSCPTGTIPSVNGTCWGPCLPASECTAVTDCNDCGPNEVCVSSNVFETALHCVPTTTECAADPSCACTNACEQQCSDENGVSCFCVTC